MKILNYLAARHANLVSAMLICSCLGACVANKSSPHPVAADVLLGTWQVDLRPSPDSEPYYKEFVVESVADRSFTGTFYDTTVSQARINTDWGTLRIAFTTVDGSGAYNHSAVLKDDKLEGLSNSTGRDFLSYWSAIKQ